MATVKDAQWNPATKKWDGANYNVSRTLLFTLTGAPPTVHTLTLQKKSGEYFLCIWNEVRNFDEGARREIVNAPVPVTLRLSTPVKPDITVLTQSADGSKFDSSVATVQNGILSLAVPDAPLIIRLSPLPVSDKIAPVAPTGLVATATENSANISWKPVADAAGYFVFRNGRYIAHAAGTKYADTSTWLRPGLGYTYAVQAYDAAGNVSPRKSVVAQTAPRFPDMTVKSLTTEPTNPRPGQSATFIATVRNAGDGATPNGVPVSVTFYVNGWYTTFGGTDNGRTIAAGETVTVRARVDKLDLASDAKGMLLAC